jgi:hypothetical protein
MRLGTLEDILRLNGTSISYAWHIFSNNIKRLKRNTA